jgi:hypothetical protein
VLFSNADVAAVINRSFEPVWESVRPVPLVHIDFGNGNVVTRTLHGNIATYVCTTDGQVLDVLPGIYEPITYLDRLNQFRLLARFVDQDGKQNREKRLGEYHKIQAESLAKYKLPALLAAEPVGKRAIERGIKLVIQTGELERARKSQKTINPSPALTSADDLASWKALAEDTRLNETVRRQQIHEILAKDDLIRPKAITKRLYKEVLHADLDDPYLGLGNLLFANYPFQDKRE